MMPTPRRMVPILVLLLGAPCCGWGRDGHRIVGEIATHHLIPEAKAGVQPLLGGQYLAAGAAEQVKSNPPWPIGGSDRRGNRGTTGAPAS